MTRDDRIALFLARNGYEPADAEPLAQDASFRRYLRIRGPRPAVLMDAPPPEDVRPFLRIAAHLHSLGLSAPAVIDADETNGLVLEEDLGDDLLSVLLDRGHDPDPLLDAAVDALIVLQRAAPPAALPAWDAPAMAADRVGHAVRLVVAGALQRPAAAGGSQGDRRRLGGHARTRRGRAGLSGSSRLVRRQPALAAAALRPAACRDHRLPGCRARPSGL